MSARLIRALSVLFFVVLVGAMVTGALVIRNRHAEDSSRLFYSVLPKADQILKTFDSADLALRDRLSKELFGELERSDGAQAFQIETRDLSPSVRWFRNQQDMPQIPLSLERVSQSDFQTAVFASPLGSKSRAVLVTTIFEVGEFRVIGIAGLLALTAWVLFLLFRLALVSKDSDGENADGEGRAVAGSPSLGPQKAEKPRAAAISPETAPVARSAHVPEPGTEEKFVPVSKEEAPDEVEEKDSKFVLLDRKSGVTREKFLEYRLDKELQRSTENALELSLVLLRFNNIRPEATGEAAGFLIEEFSHEDLIFEYGPDAFCVILPQQDLDQAIARMEMFIRKTDLRMGPDVRACAGLSSRNGRILDSRRFLRETQSALKKANFKEGRIVGFRPDPVRFRNFLKHHRV